MEPGEPIPFTSIPLMGFFGTFSSIVVGTGIMLFILVTWDSDLFSGLSAAAIAVTYAFSPLVAGKVSDRIGRARAIEISTTGNLAVGAAYATIVILTRFTTHPALLFAILATRAVEGFTFGFFWPVLQAAVGDIARHVSASENTPRASTLKQMLSRYNTGWNAGTIAGQACVWVMVSAGALELLLFMPLIGYVMNAVLTWRYLPALPPASAPGEGPASPRQAQEPWTGRHAALALPVVVGLGVAAVYGYYIGGVQTTTTNLFERSGAAMHVGLVEMIRQAFQTLAVMKIKLRPAASRAGLATVTWLLAGILAVVALVSTNLILVVFIGVYAAIGLLSGVIFTEAQNLVLSNTRDEHRGKMAGLYEAVIGIGFFFGPLVAGVITEFSTYPASYLVVTAVVVVAALACSAFAAARRR